LLVAVLATLIPLPLPLRAAGPVGPVGPGVIVTIAGGRTPAGPLLVAPRTAAIDDQGRIFFTDTDHNLVRMLDAAGVVTTIAGDGTPGDSGDGGPATAAQINSPHGVAVDNRGHVYIADSPNDRIRMVTLDTGIITTVAGTGHQGFSGDGGPATAAELDHPRFLLAFPDGSLIIADTDNKRVRAVSPAGIITTIAGTGVPGIGGDGGPATAAQLDDPRGLALDGDGNLYVSNAEGVPQPTVRRIDAAGVITTVAGGHPAGFSGDGGPATAAQLNVPRSIAVSGRILYIADSDNNRIRRVNLDTGIIDTVAGTGVRGFSGDKGPATRAQLDGPRGVAVTASGDLIVVDTKNARIRLVGRPPGSPPPPPAPTPGPTAPGPTAPGEPVGPAEPGAIAHGAQLGSGYWLVASDGRIFAFGDARYLGSMGAIPLNRPIVGMAATPTGNGYWLVASDGGLFTFGVAKFSGSTGAIKLNKPIVGMTATPTGNGYWLVASDGGIFAFGDAAFYGSTGAIKLNKPIVSMTATPASLGTPQTPASLGTPQTPGGDGYWLVASDGGIFAFGDAAFYGSPAAQDSQPVVGLTATASGAGYRLATSGGGVLAFGDAVFSGSVGAIGLRQPIVGMAAYPG
jgi:sugar lactone lactonase YvrE